MLFDIHWFGLFGVILVIALYTLSAVSAAMNLDETMQLNNFMMTGMVHEEMPYNEELYDEQLMNEANEEILSDVNSHRKRRRD